MKKWDELAFDMLLEHLGMNPSYVFASFFLNFLNNKGLWNIAHKLWNVCFKSTHRKTLDLFFKTQVKGFKEMMKNDTQFIHEKGP
jgi:hypothetical protein